jgi:hypothetical protein
MPRWIVALLLFAAAPALAQAPRSPAPWRCGEKRYCTQMTSCAEARFHFETCGLRRLDGDGDGTPCERLCGQGGSTRRR